MCPAWLLVVVVVVGMARGAVAQCWEHPSCQELISESSMMECLQLCRSDLTSETPLSSAPPPAKRSYSMEHFRWAKPVVKKRRPVKVFPGNSLEVSTRDLGNGLLKALQAEKQKKKDGPYKMKHFRWSGPPESKRYGGFMKSWDGRSPLISSLFRNVINKDAQQKKK